ncbi:MAG: transcription antitermination factor NusB [Gammaproteobacteria bacterium]
MKSSSPTRSRDKALQSLYEADLQGVSLKEILNKDTEIKNAFYKDLMEGVIHKIDDLDEIIIKNTNRKVSEIDPIERNILRLSISELIDSSTQPAILINEGIRMAKKYGSIEGYKFVNAVLDKFVKEIKV